MASIPQTYTIPENPATRFALWELPVAVAQLETAAVGAKALIHVDATATVPTEAGGPP